MKICHFFKIINKTYCAKVVTTNSFALNFTKSLQIYFFFVKCQARNDFKKDVERKVIWVYTVY